VCVILRVCVCVCVHVLVCVCMRVRMTVCLSVTPAVFSPWPFFQRPNVRDPLCPWYCRTFWRWNSSRTCPRDSATCHKSWDLLLTTPPPGVYIYMMCLFIYINMLCICVFIDMNMYASRLNSEPHFLVYMLCMSVYICTHVCVTTS